MRSELLNNEDKNFIDDVRKRYDYHSKFAAKLKVFLDSWDDTSDKKEVVNEPSKTKPLESTLSPTKVKEPKKTFEEVVLEILSDGQPRLVSELIEDYFKISNVRFKTKDFSSKLSIRAKSGNKIKNIKFNDFPLEKRFWWGKSSWFEGNLLKPDYTNKIHEKFKNM